MRMKMITIAMKIGNPGMRTKVNLVQGMRKTKMKEITMNTMKTKTKRIVMITIADKDTDAPTSMMKMKKAGLDTATGYEEIITGGPRTTMTMKIPEQEMDAGVMAVQAVPVVAAGHGPAEAIPADKAALKITDPDLEEAAPADLIPAIQAQAEVATEVSAATQRDIL